MYRGLETLLRIRLTKEAANVSAVVTTVAALAAYAAYVT